MPSQYKTFNNAPITEALLDFKVLPSEDISIQDLEKYFEIVKDRFPNKKIKAHGEINFEIKIGEEPKMNSSTSPKGLILSSNDGKKIIQISADEFTFNKLKPYDNWDSFSTEAAELWLLFLKLFKPKTVSRIGLRYINLIELPRVNEDLKEYITTLPEISQELPQSMLEFFMRIVIPDKETNNIGIIIETVDTKKITDRIFPFIFDIDVYRKIDPSVSISDLWEIVESLRDFKNQIFFNSVTEKTQNLFD